MQTILKEKENMHQVFDDIEYLYKYVSDETYEGGGLFRPSFDSSFEELVDLFNTYDGDNYSFNYVDKHYEQLDYEVKDKDMVICFSGGKDSIASTLYYLEQGYNVHLYHLKGINFSIHDEPEIAQEVADKMGLELVTETVAFSGHHRFMEHPMKNMIIANFALQYAIEHDWGVNLAFANYNTSKLEENPMEVCGGDCMDMWQAYLNMLADVVPDLTINCCLESMGQTLDILTKRMDLLNVSISCLCRHSLRPFRHDWVKEKFGVDLPKYRCGSCYKCCVEYMYLADHDLITFSSDYYKYCVNQLYKVCQRENVTVNSAFQVWYHFMFYPIFDSKIYEDLCAALPKKTGMKFPKVNREFQHD